MENKEKIATVGSSKKSKKIWIIISVALVVAIVAAILIIGTIQKQNAYDNAVSLLEEEQYEQAILEFRDLGDYKDSKKQIDYANRMIETEANYQSAVSLYNSGSFGSAKATFSSLSDYKDTADYLDKCETGVIYEEAYALEKSDIQKAYNLYKTISSDFYLVAERIAKIEPLLGLSGEYYGVHYYDGDRYEINVNVRITIDGDTVLVNGDHSEYISMEDGFPESVLKESIKDGYNYEFSFVVPGSDGATTIYLNGIELLQMYNGHYNYELQKVN